MPNANFCQGCGGRLLFESIEGRERGRCSACENVHYEQLIVGAGALIERDGQLLLLKRTNETYMGFWNLPAGHVEADEDPKDAAVREVFEESGLIVEVASLFDSFFFNDHPRGCGVFLAYKCHVLGGSFDDAEPGASPTYFASDELPENLAHLGHKAAILAWQERSRNAERGLSTNRTHQCAGRSDTIKVRT